MILINHGLFSAKATRLMISRPSPKRTDGDEDGDEWIGRDFRGE